MTLTQDEARVVNDALTAYRSALRERSIGSEGNETRAAAFKTDIRATQTAQMKINASC